ncbi:acyltransferase [Blastococcus sp. TF02A-30]|uniref:acyltransferase family protein n=1 Tax=Blastococcus sp. TF02A-30 TaxID=2250580 RepID=UPI001313F486|nr:acyltransferase [Blastococcus sp. TF02A-30]
MSSRHAAGDTRRSIPAAAAPSERLTSLDGLRGLAALVVVVHHCALVLPSLAAQAAAPDRSAATWWLTYTPAHLLWAGGEAVLVFFVLSGLVLALPHLRPSRPGTWLPYYCKRVLRLYVPVIVAVALTGALVTLFPRTADPAQSWWMNAHAVPVQLLTLVHDAWLLDGTGWLNSALWSLEFEVAFSLLLPVFVVLARPLAVPLWGSVPAVLLACGWATARGHERLSYLMVFAVGVLLAQRLPTLRAWADRINGSARSGLMWSGLGGLGVLVLLGEWWLKLVVGDPTLWSPIGRPAGVLGAAVLVFCFLHCRSLRALGNSRPLQWLGTVSFSLYLVHEPIVVSVATLVPSTPLGVLVVLAVGVPVSFLVAVVFHRAVERPSQLLAGWAGRVVRRRVAPPVPDPAETVRLAAPVPAVGPLGAGPIPVQPHAGTRSNAAAGPRVAVRTGASYAAAGPRVAVPTRARHAGS